MLVFEVERKFEVVLTGTKLLKLWINRFEMNQSLPTWDVVNILKGSRAQYFFDFQIFL